MLGLSERDLRRFSKATRDLHATATPENLPHAILAAMNTLIDASFANLDLFDPAGRLTGSYSGVANLTTSKAQRDFFQAHVHEHPTLMRLKGILDEKQMETARWSDYVSQRQLERTGLCQDFCKPIGVRHQLGLLLKTAGEQVVGLSFNRSRRDFTEEESQLLHFFADHVQMVVNAMETRARLERLQALSASALEQRSLLVVGAAGEVLWATGAATERLQQLSGEAPGALVPPPLQAWLQTRPPRGAKLTVTRSERRYSITVWGAVQLPSGTVFQLNENLPGTLDSLVLEVQEAIQLSSPRQLQHLDVTTREREVLFWIAHGKRDAEIATILHLKPRTVEKHVSNLLLKLQVETRGSAAAEVWASLQPAT